MQRTLDIDAYHRAPEGTYMAGSTWLHLAWDRETFATFLWGRPTADDVCALVEALRAEMTPHAAPHTSHADVSGLEAVDPSAYARLAEYLESVRTLSASRIRAQSVVFGPGLAGSIAAGFFTAWAAPFPFRAFASGAEAAAFLGVGREALTEWESLVEGERKTTSELRALRAWLTHASPDASLASAARALGTSARTLQRRLLDRSTTFRRELDLARLAHARARLDARDEKLAVLAADLGFASHQHFADWFKKLTGLSPSEYRANKRSPG